MLDLSKPIQTRGGQEVVILNTDTNPSLLGRLSSGGAYVSYKDGLIAYVDGDVRGYLKDGSYVEGDVSDYDLINVPEEPKVTTEYRTFCGTVTRAPSRNLGSVSFEDLNAALLYCRPELDWDGVLEITRTDGAVTDVVFHSVSK